MVQRYRERVAFDSLRDLILHMGAIREGRTAVIAVSEGWVLYRRDETLTHMRRDPVTGTPSGTRSREHRRPSASDRAAC